jgi:hypothetical protein
MKKLSLNLFCIVVLVISACTSGQKSPVDSHPGSGSVKEDAAPENYSEVDTARKDSARKDSINRKLSD